MKCGFKHWSMAEWLIIAAIVVLLGGPMFASSYEPSGAQVPDLPLCGNEAVIFAGD